MRKAIIMIAAAAVLLAVSSCKKDKAGYYSPKQEIEKVFCTKYYTYNGTTTTINRYLAQHWVWDDDLLRSINYYNSDGTLDYTENYTYKNDRLAQVNIFKNNEYYLFSYDGKKFKQIDCYEDGMLCGFCTFDYDGSRISKVTVTELSKKKSSVGWHLPQGIRLFPTEQAARAVEEALAKVEAGSKGSGIEAVLLTWDGNNVEEIVSGNEIVTFKYDNNNNPYYGFMNGELDAGYLCKNNVVNEVHSDGSGVGSYDYTYTYDKKKYPTQKIENHASGSSSRCVITDYEYDD